MAKFNDFVICSVMPYQCNYHAYCFSMPFHDLRARRGQCCEEDGATCCSQSPGKCDEIVYFGPQCSTAVDMVWAKLCYGVGFHSDRMVSVGELLCNPGVLLDVTAQSR